MLEAQPVLDSTQLARIQATHRGFLYQHLFAVGTLLLAGVSGLERLLVERDEDIEVVIPSSRIYAQIKTRSRELLPSDVEDTLERFEKIRAAHTDGARSGTPEFWIVTNAEPSESLRAQVPEWPKDVHFRSPTFNIGDTIVLPPAFHDVAAALEWCIQQAQRVPFASLGSETLVWKLAGLVLYASAGGEHREFNSTELPSLLEQLIVQLHSFPALPAKYRLHENEPDFNSHANVQLVVGFSGSGKTTWAAEGSIHCGESVVYFDIGDAPSSTVAPSLVRELAAAVLVGNPDEIKRLMLPGSSAIQSLRAIDLYITRKRCGVTVVLDNVHRLEAGELVRMLRAAPSLRWVLLGQPWDGRAAIEAAFQIEAQYLNGWSLRDVAEEFASQGCHLSPSQAQRIRRLTGGLPLFVQSSAKITRDYYQAQAERFCDEFEKLTHSHKTGQEAILQQVQQTLPPVTAQVSSLLSISDIALVTEDARFVVGKALGISEQVVSATIRELEDWGVLETLRDGRVSMHDAFRPLAQQGQNGIKKDVLLQAKKLLVSRLKNRHGVPAFRLLCRLLPEIGEMETLVDVASNESEYFHEFGMSDEFEIILEEAVRTQNLAPSDRFWAVDTIIFWNLQSHRDKQAERYLQEAEAICKTFTPSKRQREAIAIKRVILAGRRGDFSSSRREFEAATAQFPQDDLFQRILKYSYAACLLTMKNYRAASELTFPLIQEYFDVLGLDLEDVLFKNPPEIFPKIKKAGLETDALKHLADTLDLHARIMDGLKEPSPLARIHAFKFFTMANAIASAVRVGQDVVDQLLKMGDAAGARYFMESGMLRVFSEGRALDYFVPVHSQYAVVLAYCGELSAARRTMGELKTFLQASPEWLPEYMSQQRLIDSIAAGELTLAPPQNARQRLPKPSQKLPQVNRQKIGRNALCPCGSGKKYKRCCGRDV